MNNAKNEKIVVIGNGIAAISATLRCVINNDSTILISDYNKESLSDVVNNLDKIPGLSEYYSNDESVFKNTLTFIKESSFSDKLEINKSTATLIEKENDLFNITLSSGENIEAGYIIYCAGVESIRPAIVDSSEDVLEFNNVLMSDTGNLIESASMSGKKVIIYGDKVGSKESIIVLSDRFPDASFEYFNENIKSIDVFDKKITSIITESGSKLLCDFLYLLSGHAVDLSSISTLNVETDDMGLITAKEKGESSKENFFVAGQVLSGTKNHFYTALDSAVDSANTINGRIRSLRRAKQLSEFRK